MSIVKGTVHGFASMVVLVVGAMLADAVKRNVEVFQALSDLTARLLLETGNLPISEEVASIVVPVGALMGLWVFVYELQHLTE